MPIPGWAGEYVGIPYARHGRTREGADCWAIPMLIFKERYGIELPSYDQMYTSYAEEEEVRAMLRGEGSPWRKIELSAAKEGDVVWFRNPGSEAVHVGMMLDGDKFIHNGRHTLYSTIERISNPVWRNLVVGFYRHGEMEGRA